MISTAAYDESILHAWLDDGLLDAYLMTSNDHENPTALFEREYRSVLFCPPRELKRRAA